MARYLVRRRVLCKKESGCVTSAPEGAESHLFEAVPLGAAIKDSAVLQMMRRVNRARPTLRRKKLRGQTDYWI